MESEKNKEIGGYIRKLTRPYRIGRLTRPGIILRLTRKENGSKTTN